MLMILCDRERPGSRINDEISASRRIGFADHFLHDSACMPGNEINRRTSRSIGCTAWLTPCAESRTRMEAYEIRCAMVDRMAASRRASPELVGAPLCSHYG